MSDSLTTTPESAFVCDRARGMRSACAEELFYKDAAGGNTTLTNARLSIIPGYSHYNFGTSPELGESIEKFLEDPMTKPRGGEATAASKASP